MKTLASLVALAATAAAFAQTPPPPAGPPKGGAPAVRTNAAAARTATSTTETIRILALSAVQQDLRITLDQYTALAVVARSLKADATEDAAFAAVAKTLTAEQTTRLRELLVQDLGYNALLLADVRAALTMSDEQQVAVTVLLTTLQTALKAVVASPEADATRAKLAAGTSAGLAKLLTAEQDAKLRSLAGKPLGSG